MVRAPRRPGRTRLDSTYVQKKAKWRVATAAVTNSGQKRKNRALSRPSDLWHAARPNGFDSETQRWLSTLTTCWGVCLAEIFPPGRSEPLWQRATSPASMARSERRTQHGPRSWAGVIHASRRALAVTWPTLYVISKPSTVTSTMGSTKYLPPTVGVDGVSRYLAVHDESRLFVTYCVLSSEILF